MSKWPNNIDLRGQFVLQSNVIIKTLNILTKAIHKFAALESTATVFAVFSFYGLITLLSMATIIRIRDIRKILLTGSVT